MISAELSTEFHSTQLLLYSATKKFSCEICLDGEGVRKENQNGKKSKAIQNLLFSQCGLFHSVFIYQIRTLVKPESEKKTYCNCLESAKTKYYSNLRSNTNMCPLYYAIIGTIFRLRLSCGESEVNGDILLHWFHEFFLDVSSLSFSVLQMLKDEAFKENS